VAKVGQSRPKTKDGSDSVTDCCGDSRLCEYICGIMPVNSDDCAQVSFTRRNITSTAADLRVNALCACDSDKIMHISEAITTTVKPTSKLVHFEVLLMSSPTNVTLTYCESRSKWLDLIFGYRFWRA